MVVPAGDLVIRLLHADAQRQQRGSFLRVVLVMDQYDAEADGLLEQAAGFLGILGSYAVTACFFPCRDVGARPPGRYRSAWVCRSRWQASLPKLSAAGKVFERE